MEKKALLAKSDGTSIIEHSIKCSRIARELAEKVFKGKERERLILGCTIAAMFHDVGKATVEFQEHIGGNTKECLPQHNYTSAYFVETMTNLNGVLAEERCETPLYNAIISSIAHSHPLYEECNDYSVIGKIEENPQTQSTKEVIETLCNELAPYIHVNYSVNDDNRFEIIYYDDKKKTNYNPYLLCIQNVVKYADILASSNETISFPDLACDTNIPFIKPNGYEEARFNMQLDVADEILKYNICSFESYTGFGKTLVGIMYAIRNGRKTYWVCPRNTIAKGIYKNVTEELVKLNLDDKISVGLLLEGEFKEGNETSDIIVTNIDNFSAPQYLTRANYRTYDLLYSTCIMDEHHEFLTNNCALLANYDNIMRCRMMTNSKTLLISATPIDYMVNPYVDDKEKACIVRQSNKIAQRKFKVSFKEPAYVPKNTLYSLFSVKECQRLYRELNADHCHHARFTESDRKRLDDILYATHGKDCNGNIINDGSSWVSTTTITTGINVSFQNIMIANPAPERFLQTLGRCNRWGEYNDETPTLYTFLKSLKTKYESEYCAVNNSYKVDLVNMFHKFLAERIKEGEEVTIEQLYGLRKEFYRINESKCRKYYNDVILESYKYLSKLRYTWSGRKDILDNTKIISDKRNIRTSDGVSNYFVKAWVYDENEKVKGKYSEEVMQFSDYNETIKDILPEPSNNITPSKSVIKIINEMGENKVYGLEEILLKDITKHYKSIYSVIINAIKNSNTPLLLPTDEWRYSHEMGLYKLKTR